MPTPQLQSVFCYALLLAACSSNGPSTPTGTGGSGSISIGGTTRGGATTTTAATSSSIGGTSNPSGGAVASLGGVSASIGGATSSVTSAASGAGGVITPTVIGGFTASSAVGGARLSGGVSGVTSSSNTGGAAASSNAGGNTVSAGGTTRANAGAPAGGTRNAGGASAGSAGASAASGTAHYGFPQNAKSQFCIYPTNIDNERVRAAYRAWYDATITSDGAGGYLRVKKPDSGSVIGSTVSEGIGYGMLLAVYMNDQNLFDNLWKYEQSHLNANGLMDWEIGPDNQITSGGKGAATDGDEDMAWALVMADRQWGGRGSLSDSYLTHAKQLIELILKYEVDTGRNYLLKPGDQWGNVDVTNISYFAPAYYRVFGQVTGKQDEWNRVIAGNYDILERSLNTSNGNQDNGLVPAWCDSSGTPVVAYSGAPTHFQNDSTRTPFRIGQDQCYFGEPRAKAYLAKISSFYAGVGVANIVDGYNLDGTQRPEKATNGSQAASFVGPAGVGAMSDAKYQQFVDQAFAAVATLNLNAGTIYYQKSWTALSLLMLSGNFVDFTQLGN